jgi:hypothetical protein
LAWRRTLRGLRDRLRRWARRLRRGLGLGDAETGGQQNEPEHNPGWYDICPHDTSLLFGRYKAELTVVTEICRDDAADGPM